jgi:DNA polymerase
MSDARTLVARYIRQQNEIGMPDYFFTNATALTSLLPIKQAPAALLQKVPAYANVHQIKPAVVSPSPKLQAKPQAKPETKPAFALLPVAHLHGKEVSQKATGAAAVPDPKRDALVELYNNTKGCMACGLGSLRKNYVFGSGNANAPLLVIGEAPGADEDAQGKPFVGKAGELLTKMLAAIRLDRKTHV